MPHTRNAMLYVRDHVMLW